jgi:hypothetical protein
MAQIASDTKQIEEAVRHSQLARQLAWCQGPTHTYASALTSADELLAALST